MASRTSNLVRHDEAVVSVDPTPSVSHGIGETAITVVAGHQLLNLPVERDLLRAPSGMTRPDEAPSVDRLVLAIDHHRVVRPRAFEVPPPWVDPLVGVGSRVDEEGLTGDAQTERQRVRMTMRRDGKKSQRAGVGDQTDFLGSLELLAQNVVTALTERPPNGKLLDRGPDGLESEFGRIAQQPTATLVEHARLLA